LGLVTAIRAFPFERHLSLLFLPYFYFSSGVKSSITFICAAISHYDLEGLSLLLLLHASSQASARLSIKDLVVLHAHFKTQLERSVLQLSASITGPICIFAPPTQHSLRHVFWVFFDIFLSPLSQMLRWMLSYGEWRCLESIISRLRLRRRALAK
jgi:hypothetical protein